ncbi:hypothetical protein K7X08_029645 [Anisodus acutangulus]|uniref:BHLH domain-containing protein n=1 Tax=Anisodus acutangulus TaxID=402998 RepID=A0A9Q1L4P7_9SOLA|nr:hypothetical protein K7X08_029645 [Anisodus acutangulus]
MDNDYFSNGGIQPRIPLNSVNSPQELNSDYFMNTHWNNNTTDQYKHFDSALSSIVSSPAPSNEDNLYLSDLVGKLGTIGSSTSTPFGIHIGNYVNSSINNCDSTMTSCYTTPLKSPPKLHIKDKLPTLGNSVVMNATPFSPLSAAKFSCFGSCSFNGRTINNEESGYGSGTGPIGRGNLSSPSLVQNKISSQSQVEILNLGKLSGPNANSNEECSVSEQVKSGEIGTPSVLNCRKRKGKGKNYEVEDGKREKRSKEDGNGSVKMEEQKGSESNEAEKEEKGNQKISEAPKDYIHVRARRGQATDSHSLAERVRREKISQRMKLLQDLVPGCTKVTGKALMLDEIINYVQSLQRQVEFLSMKLASVNPRMDFHIDNLLQKEICQPNGSLHQHVLPLDGFGENLTQLPTICEDDLQSIVQMGLTRTLTRI